MEPPLVILQAGHSSRYAPNLPGGGGAPGEADWTSDLVTRIAAILRTHGVGAVLVGSWLVYAAGKPIWHQPPPDVSRPAALFVSAHYDAAIYGNHQNTGCIAGRATNDPRGDDADRFIACWLAHYPQATGIPARQDRLNPNIVAYYGFNDTSDQTPGVLLEFGVGMGDDHDTLYGQRDLLAQVTADCILEFLGLETAQPPDRVAVLEAALRLANLQKREFEAYIVDAEHRASVDQAAAEEGNPPIVLLLRWAEHHFSDGEMAP